MALDDSPSDFDFLTIAAATEPADGFDLSDIDLLTNSGSNDVLQLIQAAGAEGSFAGIATIAGQTESERVKQAEKDETTARIYAYLTSESDPTSQFIQDLIDSVREAQRLRQSVDEAVQKVLDAADQALSDGIINQEQRDRIFDTAGSLKARVHVGLSEYNTGIDNLQDRYTHMMADFVTALQTTGSETIPESVAAINRFVELDSELITIDIPNAHQGIPMKVAIGHDTETGQYYYTSPETGGRVNLDPNNLADAARIELIRTQEGVITGSGNKRHFANDPAAAGLADELQQIQVKFAAGIVSKGLGDQYASAFNYMSEMTLERLRLQVTFNEMQELERQISEFEQTFDAEIAKGKTPAEMEAIIRKLETDYENTRTKYQTQYDSIQTAMEGFDKSLGSILTQLNANISSTRASLSTQRQNGIADRDDQIRARFPGEIKPPGEWAVWSWTARLAASDELTEAWKNVVTHEGKDVYRDNETLRLYTYDAESGDRTYINDPAVEAELNLQAYGTPNADGSPSTNFKFFKNETPDSEDPNNGIRESYIANTSHDRVEERTKDIERRGQEQYGSDTSRPNADSIGETAQLSLKFGFGRSADFISDPIGATVNFARSGFQTGLNMAQAFSGNATETQVAAVDTPAPTDGTEITPDPTLKTTV